MPLKANKKTKMIKLIYGKQNMQKQFHDILSYFYYTGKI